MMEKRILLTAFRNTSSQQLLHGVAEYSTILLPNDKLRDSQNLIDLLSREEFDYIISLGQKPNIRNKLHIETTAGKGDANIDTDVDCEKLRSLFEAHGICAKISHNAGTSYCNELYWNGLRYLSRNALDTNMVFLHIPYHKNLENADDFRRKFQLVLRRIKEGQL